MAKLNQIIAIAQGKKGAAKKEMEHAYHLFEKGELFNGLVREYRPLADEGEKLPSENKKIQFNVDNLLAQANKASADMFDVVIQQDLANCEAKADVVVDGKTILKNIPATSLIFIEKQLTDFEALIGRVPTLDLNENWQFDEGKGLHVSNPVETHRTVKKQEPLVLYPATPEHPAQTQIITKDEIAGYWRNTKMSGAWTTTKKNEVLARVKTLKEAVIIAREQANNQEVQTTKIGKDLLSHIFGNNLV